MGLTLAERMAITETTATRYQLASKRGKGAILDELCANTGWHRNHARKALKAALPAQNRDAKESSSIEVRAGCDCRIGGVLDGARNASR
jgi:hypothetical protein